jgi:hypothetical protein
VESAGLPMRGVAIFEKILEPHLHSAFDKFVYPFASETPEYTKYHTISCLMIR